MSALALRADTSPASDVKLRGKLIQEYALTSANDFPQRDPVEWRLLGSNDGGRTWTTLDARKDEIFSERHQRKTFKIASPNTFEIYRLQIDHVRDRRVANSVQLAEIELMGADKNDSSPTPVFTDVITAQGDNPPAESVFKLFDGRVETKWLDRPADRTTCASWIQWKYVSPDSVLITNLTQLLSLRARAADGYHVKFDGIVAGHFNQGGLYVMDSAECIGLHEVPNADQFKTGQRVTIEGASIWKQNYVDLAQVRVSVHGATPPEAPEPISLEQPMPPDEDLKWVEVEGAIQFRGNPENRGEFELQDGNLAMQVCLQHLEKSESLPEAGARVVVRGICRGAFNEQGQWIAVNLWADGIDALTPAGENTIASSRTAFSSQPKNSNTGTVITKIEQIRKLSQDQLRARPAVKIRGIITDLVGAFIQDDTAGIQFAFPADNTENRKITDAGTFVEMEGVGGLGDLGNPIVSANRITVLGRGKFPQPERLTLTQLMSGRMDAQWIEMDGVVRATDGAHLLMNCYGREVMASVGAGSAAVVNGLVDAAVRVRGVGVTALDEKGRIQGIHLLIPSLEQLEVVEAPGDPFSKPVQPIGSLLGVSGPGESFHRVHLKGVLTLQEGQKFFLQDTTGSAMGILKEDVVLDARFGRSRWLFWQSPQGDTSFKSGLHFSPGDQLEVVGFPETRGYSPVLTEVVVRKVDGSLPVKTVNATPDSIGAGTLDSTLVTLDGVVRGQNSLGAHNALALEWMDRILQVLVSTNVELPAFVPGTRLRVKGICQIDPMPYPELGLRVGAVRILTRSADDFLVLARPPWWTVRRALSAMGGMAFVILAAFIWIRQLRSQVEERTKQLASEIQLREQTERQRSLEKERARIAQDLHDDLGANLTQIVFLSQRVEAAQQEPQEVERWFHLIPATARKTIQSLDEIVWAINPRHDSLESFANYLSQFAQQHMGLAGVRCVLDVPTVLPAMMLTAEVRHKLLLAAREALQNVATHATATEARVTLQLDDDALTIIVSDNGRGFDTTQANRDGNGLSNMRRRLDDIGGRTEIVSQPGNGTTVRLVIQRNQLHGRVIAVNGHSG